MMPRCVSLFVLLSSLAAAARAADAPAGPAADIPELAVLNHYVGDWESKMTVKNSDNAQPAPTVARTLGEWILDGRFLRQTWSVTPVEGVPALKGSSVKTYDVQRKTYRGWTFFSNGFVEETEGKWDEATRTLTWTAVDDGSGRNAVQTSKFADDGSEQWSMTENDRDGNVLSEVSGTAVRQSR
jgi:hypothetical protein